MRPGNRTIIVVSLNPDNFTSQETKIAAVQMIRKQKIHIEAIQETHIPHDHNYKFNGYRIITTNAIPNSGNNQGIAEGGVSILIHEELEQHITHIQRVNQGIVKITLHSAQSHQ